MAESKWEPGSEHLEWLDANGHGLAPLTGTDTRALKAIAQCWEVYAYTRQDSVLVAVCALLQSLQPKCWPLAKELIARSMDWSDRDPVWKKTQDIREAGAAATRLWLKAGAPLDGR